MVHRGKKHTGSFAHNSFQIYLIIGFSNWKYFQFWLQIVTNTSFSRLNPIQVKFDFIRSALICSLSSEKILDRNSSVQKEDNNDCISFRDARSTAGDFLDLKIGLEPLVSTVFLTCFEEQGSWGPLNWSLMTKGSVTQTHLESNNW